MCLSGYLLSWYLLESMPLLVMVIPKRVSMYVGAEAGRYVGNISNSKLSRFVL